MTDPIADMLTRIRNAQMAKKLTVAIPYSKLKLQLAEIMVREGYLAKIEKNDENKGTIILTLKYVGRTPHIKNIQRVSTGGRRIYVGHKNLPEVLNGLGVAIISTSKGLLTSKEAQEKQVGGEVICELY